MLYFTKKCQANGKLHHVTDKFNNTVTWKKLKKLNEKCVLWVYLCTLIQNLLVRNIVVSGDDEKKVSLHYDFLGQIIKCFKK